MNPTPEERERMVNAALRDFRKKHEDKPSFEEQTMNQARVVAEEVVKIGRDVLKADPTRYDRNAMLLLLHKLFQDKFQTWEKEQLIFVLAVMHVEFALDAVENSL